MNDLHNKLKNLSGGQVSSWKEKAQWRLKNRSWLKLSSNIARRMAASLEDNEAMNQKKLAEQVGVSAQYISKVLKGEENLTLETIAKLSEALGTELIAFPEYKYSQSVAAPTFSYSTQALVIDLGSHVRTINNSLNEYSVYCGHQNNELKASYNLDAQCAVVPLNNSGDRLDYKKCN